MDWPSVFAGAGAAASLIGVGLIPALKLRAERRTSLRAEAAEERERRLLAEQAEDGLRDALEDAEQTATRAESALALVRGEVAALRAENARLRPGKAAQGIIAHALADPRGEIVRVFDASRDLWCIFTPSGEVLAAMGPWERIGLAKADQLGMGWRQFLAKRSYHDSDLAIARALADGGKVGLWHAGKASDGRPGEYCLKWSYGRYNGETLAVAQVVAFRATAGPDQSQRSSR
jgi:hypothetical protein